MLTQKDMEHLSRLSRLAPDEATLAKFGAQCGDILKYMDILSEIDTSGVEPLYSPVAHEKAIRQDREERRWDRSQVLANAPESDGQFFVVPRIV